MSDPIASFESQLEQEDMCAPNDYMLFLKDIGDEQHLLAMVGDRQWRLYSATKLIESVPFGRHHCPRWRIPFEMAEMIRDLDCLEEWGDGLGLEELRKSIAVAESNGDLVIITQGGDVWEVLHDGFEVTHLSSSWSDFSDISLRTLPEGKKDLRLLGNWAPTGSSRVPERLYAIVAPSEVIITECDFEERFRHGVVKRYNWSTEGSQMKLWNAKEELFCKYTLNGDVLEWEVVDALSQYTFVRKRARAVQND